jgi:hypothetical protein
MLSSTTFFDALHNVYRRALCGSVTRREPYLDFSTRGHAHSGDGNTGARTFSYTPSFLRRLDVYARKTLPACRGRENHQTVLSFPG